MVHADFMTIGNQHIFVLKYKASGFIWARLTKDMTMESATNTFHKYVTSYDRPRLVVTDGGPCFQSQFLEYLNSHYMQHHYSSAYRAQSNSPAERGVRSLKDVLLKMASFTDKTLRTVIFNINNHVAPDGYGSLTMRFFKRRIRTGLPTAIEK